MLVILVSLIVLFAPGSDVPGAPAGTDKLVHGALFAALGASGWWAGAPLPVLAPLLAAYAGGSELLQTIPALQRDGTWADFVTDLIGLAAGLALVVLAAAWRGRSDGEAGVAGPDDVTRSDRRRWR